MYKYKYKPLKKEQIKGFIGILLIVIAMTGIYLWESGLREAYTYEQVLTAAQDIPPGEVVTEDMLAFSWADPSHIISNPVTNPDVVIGKMSSSYIPRSAQICDAFFSDSRLALKENEYIFAIPEEWIYSIPQSLRRGDQLHFYPVPVLDDGAGVGPMPPSPAASCTAVFVKDNSNREVTDMDNERLDGTTTVGQVEVIMDKQKYHDLLQVYLSGYLFVLAYE